MTTHDSSGGDRLLIRERTRSGGGAEAAEEPESRVGGPCPYGAEIERRRADLAGRLVRDRAAAESELELAERHAAALRDRLAELDEESAQLAALTPSAHSENDYALRLDRLFLRYWRNAGRLAASASTPPPPPRNRASAGAEIRPLGVLMHEAFPHIFGLVLAALIVSGALALIFC